MRKILFVILLLALGWIVKLSYDMFQISQQIPQFQQDILKLEQSNASLNDQIVALQRQLGSNEGKPAVATDLQQPVHMQSQLNPVMLIKQQLQLIQFALQQQQYTLAVDKLNGLDVSLGQYDLAATLKQSLHEAILRDRQAIQQFVLMKQQQQEQFNNLLSQMDKILQQSQQDDHVQLNRKDNALFWQDWLQFEKVKREPAALLNRQILIKEVQLRLILAKQALNLGQVSEYQNTVQMAIQQIAELPDRDSQQLKQKLEKIKQVPVLPIPKLAALELLG